MRFASLLYFLVCILVVCCIPAAVPQNRPATAVLEDPQWVREVRSKPLVYSLPEMARVTVEKDLIYKHADGTDLKADVYSPRKTRKGQALPIIVFIHGGYLPPNLLTPPKEWVEYRSWGRLAAASGFVGVVFNHRFFSNFSSLPAAQADLSDLIAFVRSHAESFGADKNRINLWAFSGGGYLLSQPLREPQPYIRALVAYYTILDFTSQEKADSARVPADIGRNFSPLEALAESNAPTPPIFIGRAGLDHPLRNGTIDRFISLALQKNVAIRTVNHSSGHHGFDVEDNSDATREVIRATLEFVRANN